MPGSIRLFVEFELAEGGAVSLAEPQAHYLVNVMRRAAGDEVRLFNGRDGEWQARISVARRKNVELILEQQTRPQNSEPDFHLCFALLKRARTDLVVEKATELGVSVIQPVITTRTQADHVNLARLRAIAIEAAEQCERLMVPQILMPVSLAELLAHWPADRRLMLADERRNAPVAAPPAGGLLIGPEGGFTDQELDLARLHPFVTACSLGARILRAETAAIAGLALLLASAPS